MSTISLCLYWLGLVAILCMNTPTCQGVEKICGKRLSNALALMCQNGFGTKTKKSIDPVDYYSDIDNAYVDLPFDESSFLSKIPSHSNSLTKTRRRRHLGVYDECCRKPCRMAELRSYCL